MQSPEEGFFLAVCLTPAPRGVSGNLGKALFTDEQLFSRPSDSQIETRRLILRISPSVLQYANTKKPLVLFTYLDAQEHLPYADDSAAVTPKSELNGGIVVDTPTRLNLARKYSYSSHTGGKEGSYTSHTDLRYEKTRPPTKESALRKKMAAIFSSTSTAPSCAGGAADRLGNREERVFQRIFVFTFST